jgi:hypothetical protein
MKAVCQQFIGFRERNAAKQDQMLKIAEVTAYQELAIV